MKYVVVLGDGMADEPMEELGGEEPLLRRQRRRCLTGWLR